MDKINASKITSSRSLKGVTFLLAGWRLSHPKELPGDLPVLLDCHTLTMNTIVLQLSDADISMLQCSAQFRILFINAHFVVDNATHALASSATARPTFNVEEEDVIIRNGWTPKEEKEEDLHQAIPQHLFGRRGHIERPPRSSDLLPMAFFFWGCSQDQGL